MAIAYRAGSYTNGVSTSVTSVTVTLPTGWAAGDVAIVAVGNGGTSTEPSSSGWTKLGAQIGHNVAVRTTMFYRVLQGGDSNPSFSWTTSSNAPWQAISLTGADNTNPKDQFSSGDSSSGTAVACAGLTPAVTPTMLVWAAFQQNTNAITKPTSMTSAGTGTTTWARAMAYENYTGMSATGARDGTTTTGSGDRPTGMADIKEAGSGSLVVPRRSSTLIRT